ncbi:uncharacterized protein A1O9_02180 [Exophiala aquamarina CBS 119918]|uniref:Uncharacterized protein n=1 Tax=Exophiala aquamarina CBS 119918 TaxID=1182545 RepID=A0A072PKH7_9EURO|nr:uncharacterized protein A1O9_02180 [Exophiala aquamarina CBS 119918]KEF60619.1 hypothetical protein A1O9_02180 [Exophiala aquamarina CBS 119918]
MEIRTLYSMLLASFVVYRVCLAVYRVFFHPLAKYPGPLVAKLTSLYMVATAAMGRNTYVRNDLHVKFGKIVRTGPNELCFADEESIKDIYGQTAEACVKASVFYKGIHTNGHGISV